MIFLPLGEGRLAVGKALDEKNNLFIGSRYAIADTSGLFFLTDFVYYDVGNYEKGLASVDDGRNTFLSVRMEKLRRVYQLCMETGRFASLEI
ncbi:hypothetical protein GCM10020331_015110 [Ectobacillus funiculus]